MKLLAIETATEACSAALLIDNDIQERYEIAPQQHTRLILPMVDELLSEAGITLDKLDAIAFGQGPGAFTGVRIATGVVQGLAFAHNLPLIPISSMAALAQQEAAEHATIAVAIDARMQEVYWGLYKTGINGLMRLVGQESVCPPDKVNLPDDSNWFGIGSGWKTYEAILEKRMQGKIDSFDAERFPMAREVALLARAAFEAKETISAEQAAPVYLRNKVVN